MNINQELKAMSERFFTDVFQALIQNQLHERKNDDYYAGIEGDYKEAKLSLTPVLGEMDACDLNALEGMFQEQQTYAERYGFDCGLYAGFEQIFHRDSFVENSFQRLVVDKLLTKPAMERHAAYHSRSEQCLGIFTRMSEKLGDDVVEHITSVEVAWDERIYSAATIAFYCGYRAAMAVKEQIKPLPDSKMLQHLILTEYELGLTLPLDQRKLHSA